MIKRKKKNKDLIKTLHRNLNIEQHEHKNKNKNKTKQTTWVNSDGAPEGQAVPAQPVALVVLLYDLQNTPYKTKDWVTRT